MRCRMLTLLVLSVAALGQDGTAKDGVAFETASIHPVKVTPGCFSMLPPGGVQYAVTCMSLRNLLEIAYGTGYIEGGGSALEATYDFRATSPGGKPWTHQNVAPMMQQFLVERFHLVVHSGKKELSGYSLVVAKSGSKLKAASPGVAVLGQKAGEASANFVGPGYVQGRSASAKGVAGLLGAVLKAPVEDHTGLGGTYNVDLRYAPDSLPGSNPRNEADESLPSFFTAVEEQLGLRLVSAKVEVDTVVIDHVDAEPTPN